MIDDEMQGIAKDACPVCVSRCQMSCTCEQSVNGENADTDRPQLSRPVSYQMIFRSFDKSPSYIESAEWAKQFWVAVQSGEGVNAKAILELARERYSQLIHQRDVVENKASFSMAFNLFAIAILLAVPSSPTTVVALALTIASTACGIMVLIPSNWPGTISIRDALESCEYDEGKQQSQLSAFLHCSIVGGAFSIGVKSWWLSAAYVFTISVGLFTLAVAVFSII